MSVELIKDLLKIDQTIGKDQTQALVEGEITLPNTKPTINKILNVDGVAEVKETKLQKDKISIKGIVNFKVLYSADDELQPVHSLDASTDFSDEIEIKGVTEQMSGDVRARIEHIDYRLTDEKNISIKTVLALDGKVQTGNHINIVKDITGVKGLQVLKETIKYNDVIGTNESSTIVNEAFEISDDMPDIVDVLRVDAKAYERETKVVENKAIVAGVVEMSVMYFGDDEDNKINYLTHEIPFTHFVEIAGVPKDAPCTVRVEMGTPSYDTREDINGNIRIIDFENVVKIYGKAYQEREEEVTVDTYSVNKKFDIKREPVVITENIGNNVSIDTIKGIIDVSAENEIIQNIYNVNAKPVMTDHRVIDGKVIIEGLVDVNMLYLGEDSGEIKDVQQEIPFKSYVDIEGIGEGMEGEVDILLDHIRFNKVNSREVEVDINLKNVVSVNRIKTIDIVTEAEELEEELDFRSKPSITIYIVQPNDSLWEIAKRYNTTVDDLIATNDIVTPDNLMPGEKIIIEKHIDFEL